MKLFLGFALVLSSIAAAECKTSIAQSTPDERFIVHNDGTVTDSHTGLMWQQCSVGQSRSSDQCAGEASSLNWQQALLAAQQDQLASHHDWRVPNIKELASLIEQACTYPAINSSLFMQTEQSFYWSNTSYAANSDKAWSIEFGEGDDVYSLLKSSGAFVRLVRDR